MYAPRIPHRTMLRNLLTLARHPIPTFSKYGRQYGANFLLHLSGERVTHFTTDAEVARHVLRRNHRNYEKSENQTGQMG